MAQVLHGYLEELNQRGGVFGRKVELLVIPYGATPQATLDNLRAAFDSEGIFALVGAYTVGLDEPVLDVLREQGAPLVGPFTLNPGDVLADAASFYIYSGFADQVRALVAQALADKPQHLVFAGPEGEAVDRLLGAARDALPKGDRDRPVTLRFAAGLPDAAALAEAVGDHEGDALLFLGNQAELEALLAALDEAGRNPRVYMLSAFVPRPLFGAPEAFDQRLFLAYPTLSSDIGASGRAEYQRLADLHALPHDHLQGQIAAFAAARLLVEGLRGGGRSLSRHSFVEALEALYRFDTGVTPPVTFGPNRRIGSRGAHVMVVDLVRKTSMPVGGWREVR
jgi:ABC-type branched-subunit amino acid transport system substrate-binding protein